MRILRWASKLWIGILLLSTLLSVLTAGGSLVLPLLSPPPLLRLAIPPDGARDVPVRTQFRLDFDVPMNPRTIERALRIEPPVMMVTRWDADYTALTISPTTNLLPSTDYRLTLAQTGLSRNLRSFSTPTTITFRTVAAPAVLATVPADGAFDARPLGPIVVRFSRAMVGSEALLQRATLPALRFEPPIPGHALWVDPTTLLFQPDSLLLPGVRYQATLDSNLMDVGGGPLGQQVGWGFTVAPPRVLELSPAEQSRNIAPHVPLRIHLSQALPRERIVAGLTISPTIAGQIATSDQLDGSQVITFTPTLGWNPSTTYRATLQLGGQASRSWSFATAPRPALIGRFPGLGQALPLDQDIRLIFSTAFDPAVLQAALQFDPPVTDVRVVGSGLEMRVSATVRAATAYTMTIPAILTDTNGVALGAQYPIRFTTASAAAVLQLPEAQGRLVTFAVGESADVLVRRTNLSALVMDLYELDEATVVRTLVFDANDWRRFEPERYQRPLRRSWTIPLSDTLNVVVEDRVALREPDGRPLPPGIYYLRIRSPEGPRIDLLVGVSRTRLALQLGDSNGVVWATDALSGTVVPNVPIALYQNDALVLETLTGKDGLARFNLNRNAGSTYAALARGPALALATARPVVAAPTGVRDPYRFVLAASASTYRVGETADLVGYVRAVVTDTLRLPTGLPNATLQIVRADGGFVRQLSVPIDEQGVFTTQIPFEPGFVPGRYRVQAEVAGQRESIALQVLPAEGAAARVDIWAPEVAKRDSVAVLLAESSVGLPMADTPISWTIAAELAPLPLPPGYTIGIGGYALPTVRSGVGRTNLQGQLTLALSETLALSNVPLRYHLTGQIAGDTPQKIGEASFIVHPSSMYIGMRVQRQVVLAGRPVVIDVLAIDSNGQPMAGKALQVTILNIDGTNNLPLVTRRLVTNADGVGQVEQVLERGRHYLVRASAIGSNGQQAISEVPFWLAGAPTLLVDQPVVIPDQPSYTIGQTATLLLGLPGPRAAALITRSGATTLAAEVRAVAPGDVLTLTLTEQDMPGAQVTLFAPAAYRQLEVTAAATVPIAPALRTPSVQIQADQAIYAAGATAVLTVTTTDASGQLVPTDLLVTIAEDGLPPIVGQQADFQQAATETMLARPIYWSGPLRNERGMQVLTVALPAHAGRLRVVAVAAGETALMVAKTDLVIQEPLRVALELPPFVRRGDLVELGARIVNTTPFTQSVALRLVVDGLAPQSGTFVTTTTLLGPFGRARLAWRGRVDARDEIQVQVVAQSERGIARAAATTPLLEDSPAPVVAGAFVTDTTQLQIVGDATGGLQIDLASTPDGIAVRAADAVAHVPLRSGVDEAGLLMLTAPLSDRHAIAQAALDRLRNMQRSDGGWGWWPTLRSNPLVTAAVLEAYAVAREAGLSVPEQSRSAALMWAEAAIADPGLTIDTQAQLAYALVRHGRVPSIQLAALERQASILDFDGAAALLLALPISDTAERAAVLQQLVRLHQENGAGWPVTGSGLGRGAATNGLVLLALQQAAADRLLQNSARDALARQRGPEGWATAFDTARAIQALRSVWRDLGVPQRVTVELNGERLVDQRIDLPTTTVQLQIPGPRLSATNQLTVTVVGGAGLLSYRLTGSVPAAQPTSDPTILQDTLPDGTVRLTVLVQAPIAFALLRVPLAPGAEVRLLAESGPFVAVGQATDRLVLAAEQLDVGVYEIRYRLLSMWPGQFGVPPAQIGPTAGGNTIQTR